MNTLSNQLMSNKSDDEKIKDISSTIAPIEELDALIYIEADGEEFYSSTSSSVIFDQAMEISPSFNMDVNSCYFGDNGFVFVSRVKAQDCTYRILVTDPSYAVSDANVSDFKENVRNISNRVIIMMATVLFMFIITIVGISLVAARLIQKPIKKLAAGADKIAKGDLDAVIDYESTNAIGTTVKSFNEMTQKLKRSLQEQKRIEESRNIMVAGLAHDLRTPLTSIKGYVEGIRDGIANTPEKQAQYIETIYSSANNMEKMIDDLMTVSQFDHGKTVLNQKVVNINDVMANFVEEITPKLNKFDFEFQYINHCEDVVLANLDVDRFSRVLTNIVINSIKYRKTNVKSKLTITSQSYEKAVIISIADNGIGVDSESLGKIFEPFYRNDPARSKVHGGSGIGLNVCKRIVELHGGLIWATGEEGEGLTINISLNREVGGNNE
jgi:signal transduction histidine kinase